MGISAFALFFSFAVQLRMRSPILHERESRRTVSFSFFSPSLGHARNPMHGAASGEE